MLLADHYSVWGVPLNSFRVKRQMTPQDSRETTGRSSRLLLFMPYRRATRQALDSNANSPRIGPFLNNEKKVTSNVRDSEK
jgi:hypothetical protein